MAAAATVVLALGLMTPSGAAPAQDCGLLNPCQTTTTVDETPGETTTSLAEETTTTEGEVTSTTESEATTTTRRSTATTGTTVKAEEPTTSSTLSVTTSSNVLVPGDGTAGAESTTTTLERATTIADDGPSDGTLIALVIAGLVVLAVAVAILTWRYWVATRPPLREPGPDATAAG